jgi:molybdopterin-guanine dinucleotide biosynthesis protein A
MIQNDIHKIGYLLKQVNTNIIEFEDDNEFINLNNKEDYLKAKTLEKEYTVN